ncbi:MAG: 16S rRNA (cytidine(1402)-2'-O)-methyltransferase [Thermodesulfobacteriota bacterium]
MKEKTKKSTPGRLYLVSTPIGNMEDITLRALRVLKEVDLVAAEDTRVARKLFSTYGIKTPLESCFESNEDVKADFFLRRLQGGSDIALISDAGTPGVSDPGFRLTETCLEKGIAVRTVPGPCSVISALSVSGFSMESFSFMGFVPRAAAKRKRFYLSLRGEAVGAAVVFETARRLKASLADAREVLGDVSVVMARELTKVHEEVMRGAISEVLGALEGRVVLGEVALVFRLDRPALTEAEAGAMMEELLRAGLPLKEVVKAVTRESGASRTGVYKEALAMKVRLGL